MKSPKCDFADIELSHAHGSLEAMNVMEMIDKAETIEPRAAECTDDVVIPVDLGEWVNRPQLRRWIVEKVDTFNWNNPALVEALRRTPGFEPRALFCTMAFAYVTGTFGAEDIVRYCSRDPDYRPIRPALAPAVADVSNFRKLNRALILEVVADVIMRAMKTQFIEGDAIRFFPAGLRKMIVDDAGDRLNLARDMDRGKEE